MKRNFRRLPLILSLSIMVSLFAACESASAPATSSQAAAPAAKAEITYMAWYNNETEPKTTQAALDKFNASQDKVAAKLISVAYADYTTKLNTLASSNSLPDTAMMLESQVVKWAVNGKLTDISDMYNGNDVPLPSLAYTYKGKPIAYSCANEVLLLYYNKDIFDKAGIAYPPASADKAWTWKEFVATAQKLTKDKSGKTPIDAGFDPKQIVNYGCNFNTISWMWPVLAISNGGGIVSQDGKQLLLGKQETIDAAQAIADLNLKEHVAPTPATLATFPTLDVTLLSGKVAMATGGQWEIGISIANSLKNGLHYGVGVLPKMKNPVTLNTGGTNVIFSTTGNMDAAKTFMKWYTNEDNNISEFQSGIWMPVSRKWYEQEDLLRKWADNPAHPPMDQYKSAVVDYAMDYAQQVPWYFFPGYDRMDDVISPGMDSVWTGKKTAKDAILNDILPKVKKIFEENKP